jgi:hypothetical protein
VREGQPLLDNVDHFLPRRDQLEDSAIDFPVAKLLGSVCVMAQIDDVQAVGQVVKNDAPLAAERADRAGLVQGLNVGQRNFLAPVAGSWLEPEILRRRARSEQDDVGLTWANACLVWRSLITR